MPRITVDERRASVKLINETSGIITGVDTEVRTVLSEESSFLSAHTLTFSICSLLIFFFLSFSALLFFSIRTESNELSETVRYTERCRDFFYYNGIK